MSYAQMGRTPETAQLRAAAAFLRGNLEVLANGDQNFAESLLESYDSPRGVSDKQAHWIGQLADRAEQAKVQCAEAPVVIDLTKINEMFAEARRVLQHPHILVDTDGTSGNTLRISEAGPISRYYGQLMVATKGSYENRTWLGRVTKEGQYIPSTDARTRGVVELVSGSLQALAADPVGVAKAFGRRFNICCFCSRELTDQRSVDAGYGPVCAGHYGLAWGECKAVEPVELANYGDPDEAWPVDPVVIDQEAEAHVQVEEMFDPTGAEREAHEQGVLIDQLALKLMEVHPEFYDWVMARKAEGWKLNRITDRLEQLFKIAEAQRELV